MVVDVDDVDASPDIPTTVMWEGERGYNRCVDCGRTHHTHTSHHQSGRNCEEDYTSASTTQLANHKMVSPVVVVSMVLACVVVSVTAQRSPYAGASDPGVLPQYLPDDGNRFGGNSEPAGTPPPKLHQGTLETEHLYNRVQSWPDDKKPFWFLNSVAIEAQRQQQQQQVAQQAAQNQNRRAPFAGTSRRGSSFQGSNSQ